MADSSALQVKAGMGDWGLIPGVGHNSTDCSFKPRLERASHHNNNVVHVDLVVTSIV